MSYVRRWMTIVRDFSRNLSESDYKAVVRIAVSGEAVKAGFLGAMIAIFREQFDDAARVMVAELVRNPENRSYRTWKWWEVLFGERTDFKGLSRQLIDALLRRFEAGNDAERRAIADTFGQKPDAAKMTLAEFMEAIGHRPVPQDIQ